MTQFKYSFLCFLYIITCIYACKTVNIGAIDFTSIHPSIPNDEILRSSVVGGSRETIRALKIFEEHVKREEYFVGGERICFNIVVKESDYSNGSIIQSVCELLHQGIRFMISPFGTGPGIFTNIIIDENLCGVPNLGTVIQLSGSTQERTFGHYRKSLFGTMPTLHRMMSEIIPYFRGKSHNVTLIKTMGNAQMDPSAATCLDLDLKFIQSGMDKIDTVWYDSDFISADPQNYTNVVEKVIEIDNDLVVYCGLDKHIMVKIADGFKNMNYTPKGLITTASDITVNETVMDYWTFPSSIINSEFEFENAEFIKNEQHYIDIYEDLFPNNIVDDSYKIGFFTLIAGEIMLKSMQVAESTDDMDLILDKIKRTRFNTMLGELYYSPQHENQNSGISLQKFPDQIGIFGPYQVSNTSLIYPMPTWEQRDYKPDYHRNEVIGISLISINIVIIIVWFVVLLLKRQQTIEFLIISFGLLLIMIMSLIWSPHHTYTSTCVARPILTTLGLLMIIGIIVLKLASVHYGIKSYYKVLLYSITFLTLFNLALFIFWNIFAKPKVAREVLDIHNLYENYKYCDLHKLNSVFSGIISTHILIIYVFGLYLSLILLKKKISSYSQKKIHIFILYNIGITAIVLATIEIFGVTSNIYHKYILRTVIIFISTFAVIMLIPISIIVYKNQSNTSSSSSSYTTHKQSSDDVSDKNQALSSIERRAYYKKSYIEIKEETKQLQKEAKELRKELEELKEKKSREKILE